MLWPQLFKSYGVQGKTLSDLIDAMYIDMLMTLKCMLYSTLFRTMYMSSEGDVVKRLESPMKKLKDWMTMNYLNFNDEKTEFLILGFKHHLTKVTTKGIQIGEHVIQPSPSASNIGVVLDANRSTLCVRQPGINTST